MLLGLVPLSARNITFADCEYFAIEKLKISFTQRSDRQAYKIRTQSVDTLREKTVVTKDRPVF